MFREGTDGFKNKILDIKGCVCQAELGSAVAMENPKSL